jgi:hypothetical protein
MYLIEIFDRNNRDDSIKKPLMIVAVLLGIALLAYAGRAAFEYLYITLPPQQVAVSVSYSPETSCRADSPVYMLIKNDSYREIVNTSFTLSVKKTINGDNFIQLLTKDYSTDRVIKAGESYAGCWVYPKLNTEHYVPEELVYDINSQNVVFRD